MKKEKKKTKVTGAGKALLLILSVFLLSFTGHARAQGLASSGFAGGSISASSLYYYSGTVGLTGALGSMLSNLPAWVTNIGNTITAISTTVTTTFSNVTGTLSSTLSGLSGLSSLLGKVSSTLGTLSNALSGIASIAPGIASAGSTIVSTASSLISAVTGALSTLNTSLTAVSGMATTLGTSLTGTFASLTTGTGIFPGSITSILSKVLSFQSGGLSKLFGKIQGLLGLPGLPSGSLPSISLPAIALPSIIPPISFPSVPPLPGLPPMPSFPALPGLGAPLPGISGPTGIPLPGIIPGITEPADSLCDPQVLDAIEARGYMEAQREVAMNQNLIAKPDSVLEYSCYDRLANDFVDPTRVPPLYSNFGCVDCLWVDPERIFNLQFAVTESIVGALYSYITANNFHTTFLSVPPMSSGFVNTRTDVTFTPGLPLTSYDCDTMNAVWQQAKCLNFMDEDDHDGFYDFSWYAASLGSSVSLGNDPRTFLLSGGWFTPNHCISPLLSAPYVGEPQMAFNNREDSYMLPTENPWQGPGSPDTTPYREDNVGTFSNLVLPVGTTMPDGSNITCAAPIPTGVCVRRDNMAIYPDAVCPNPGCRYEPAPSGSCAIPAGGLPASWCRP